MQAMEFAGTRNLEVLAWVVWLGRTLGAGQATTATHRVYVGGQARRQCW